MLLNYLIMGGYLRSDYTGIALPEHTMYVEREDRTVSVEREERTLVVGRETRAVWVEKDERTIKL